MEELSVKLKLQTGETCLSPKVHAILCNARLDISDKDTPHFLDENRLIAWDDLAKYLPAYSKDTYEYFMECGSALAPVFKASEACMKAISEDDFQKMFARWIMWTSSPKVLERCFVILKDERDTSSTLALLLMLPVLERSLGDVFLLKGKQCPSMIKDLLVTDELEAIFGKSTIELLRIMLGPPISLNLRNVIWHGFPQPNELPPRYGYFMLHVIISLGKILQAKGVEPSNIRHRKFITFPQIHQLNGIFPEIGAKECDLIEALISESPFVLPQMEPLWKCAVQSYRLKRHGDCIVLLLPQLEHGLRRLFALANNCPERVLTAENTVLFTTFDEILSPSINSNTRNRLHSLTGSNYITMLMDILMYPEGPRLRDRFSHGETYFGPTEETDQTELQALASYVLSVCVCFCVLCLNKQAKLHCMTYISKVHSVSRTYTSVFHPIALYKSQLKQLCQKLTRFQHIQRPVKEDISTTVEWEKYLIGGDFQCSQVYRTGEHIIGAFGQSLSKHLLSILQPFHNLDDFVCKYIEVDVETLYRNVHCDQVCKTSELDQKAPASAVNKEDEVIGLLRKIVCECVKVCEQSEASLLTKYNQWLEKKLRSRQRDTYRRMLDLCPYILCGIRQVLLILVIHLHILAQDNQELLARNLRFLKSVLQYCENLVSFTNPEKNRWEEAQKYTDDMMQTILKL